MSLAFYLLLFKHIPNRFYAVLLNIGSLSLVESFLSFSKPETENYIFGAIVTSFVLYSANLLLKKYVAKEVQNTFDGSSQIILTLSLVYGLITLGIKGNIFIWQASTGLYLSGIYYLLRYYIERNESLIASLFFFSVGTFFTTQFLSLSPFATSFTMVSLAFVNLFLNYLFLGKQKESTWLLRSSVISATLAHFYLILPTMQNIATQKEFTLITLLLLIFSLCVYNMHRKKEILYAVFGYFMLFLWMFNSSYVTSIFPYQEGIRLSLLFLTASVLYAFFYNDSKNTKEPFAFSILGSMVFSLSVGYMSTEPLYFSLIAFCHVLLGLTLLAKFKENEKIYIPAATFFIFVFSLIKTFEVNLQYIGFAEILACGILYLCSFIPTEFVTNKTQKGMLLQLSLSASIFFGLIAGLNPSQHSILSTTSLLSLILISLYFTHHYFSTKAENFIYFMSLLWLCVLLRIFYNTGIENLQYYIQPIAYYTLGWGIYGNKRQQQDTNVLIGLGLAISILPLFFQSFGQEGVFYAIYLALEGLLLIAIGIGLQEKILRIGGVVAVVLAIFAQTSEYILNLPRWLLVGGLGILILTTAIYLLRTKTKN